MYVCNCFELKSLLTFSTILIEVKPYTMKSKDTYGQTRGLTCSY